MTNNPEINLHSSLEGGNQKQESYIPKNERERLFILDHDLRMRIFHESSSKSYFTGFVGATATLDTMLSLAVKQRGSLKPDDTDLYKQRGVPSEFLNTEYKYLMFNAEGRKSIAKVTDLDPNTELEILKLKAQGQLNLVANVPELPRTDFGTIVTDPKAVKPEEKNNSVVDVYPGLPLVASEISTLPEGTKLKAKDVIEKMGNEIYVQLNSPVTIQDWLHKAAYGHMNKVVYKEREARALTQTEEDRLVLFLSTLKQSDMEVSVKKIHLDNYMMGGSLEYHFSINSPAYKKLEGTYVNRYDDADKEEGSIVDIEEASGASELEIYILDDYLLKLFYTEEIAKPVSKQEARDIIKMYKEF